MCFKCHQHVALLATKLWDIDSVNIQRVPQSINKSCLVPIGLPTFQMKPHLHFPPIFKLDLCTDDFWPWYMTIDFINQWGFPCCIYDPTLVEIHQCGWNPSKYVEVKSQMFTRFDYNRRKQQQQQWTKWSILVFPTKAGYTKTNFHNHGFYEIKL